MAMVEVDIDRHFSECVESEHVKSQLIPVLEVAQEKSDLSGEEWARVFESLGTDVEFGEAGWLDE